MQSPRAERPPSHIPHSASSSLPLHAVYIATESQVRSEEQSVLSSSSSVRSQHSLLLSSANPPYMCGRAESLVPSVACVVRRSYTATRDRRRGKLLPVANSSPSSWPLFLLEDLPLLPVDAPRASHSLPQTEAWRARGRLRGDLPAVCAVGGKGCARFIAVLGMS